MYINTQSISIAAGTTYGLGLGDAYTTNYILRGSPNMSGGNITINLPAGSGNETDGNITFNMYYVATPTNYVEATNYIIINGEKIRGDWASKELLITSQYSTSSATWKTFFIPDFRQTSLLSTDMYVALSVDAAALAANAVTTIKVLDGNITLPKIATQADQTILGNVSGGAASPIALTATQTRTLLGQSITLTGNVTAGSTAETAATGNTSISTTIANNVITVAMCTNTVNTDLLTVPLGFQVAGLTGYVPIKVPYACTVEEWGFSVTEDISAGDCVLTLYNNAGTLMGTSTVTVTGATTIAGAAPATAGFFNSSSITSNNSMTAGQLITIKYVKATGVGGRGFANIKIKRA